MPAPFHTLSPRHASRGAMSSDGASLSSNELRGASDDDVEAGARLAGSPTPADDDNASPSSAGRSQPRSTWAMSAQSPGAEAPPTSTPFPMLRVILCGVVLFVNSMGMVLVFPMAPFMVQSFFPELDKHELGYKAGYLGSAYHVGGMLASIFWGRQSDKYGRRPTLLAGLVGCTACILAFGFSSSYAWALASRFLWGVLGGGNIGIVKSQLAEICTDEHRARGFSILGVNGGLARIVAPAIAGYLSEPARKYEALNVPLLRAYPYLLPCVLTAAIGVVATVSTAIFLPETLDPALIQPLPCAGVCCCCSRRRGRRGRHGSRGGGGGGAYELVGIQPSSSSAGSDDRRGGDAGGDAAIATQEESAKPPKVKLLDIIGNSLIFRGALLYGIGAFAGIVTSEVTPLFLLNTPEHGGFGFDTESIATVVLVTGPILLLYQLLVYPKITKRVGVRATAAYGALVAIAVNAAMPSSSSVASAGPAASWTVVIGLYAIGTMARISLLTCVFVLISNAAAPHERGTANGFGQTCASIARMLGPTVGGVVFAWSEDSGMPWPFNYSLVFYCLTFVMAGFWCIVRALPASLEKTMKTSVTGVSASGGGGGGASGGGDGRAEVAGARLSGETRGRDSSGIRGGAAAKRRSKGAASAAIAVAAEREWDSHSEDGFDTSEEERKIREALATSMSGGGRRTPGRAVAVGRDGGGRTTERSLRRMRALAHESDSSGSDVSSGNGDAGGSGDGDGDVLRLHLPLTRGKEPASPARARRRTRSIGSAASGSYSSGSEA